MVSRARTSSKQSCALGSNLKARFQNQHMIVGLNEAITLYKYVLQLRPAGHASHPTNLHDHAICLIERFHVTTVVDDLEEAISLEQEALELSVPGDPSYDASKDSLATCLQMEISRQVSQTSQIPQTSQVSQTSPVSQVSSIWPVVQNMRLWTKLSVMLFLKPSKPRQPDSLTCESPSTLCDEDAQNKYKR